MDHSNCILKIKEEAVPEVVNDERSLEESSSNSKVLVEAEAVVPETYVRLFLAPVTVKANSTPDKKCTKVSDEILNFHYLHRNAKRLIVCNAGFGNKMGQSGYPMGFPSHPMCKMGMDQVQKGVVPFENLFSDFYTFSATHYFTFILRKCTDNVSGTDVYKNEGVQTHQMCTPR
jgi:hypothetical protein